MAGRGRSTQISQRRLWNPVSQSAVASRARLRSSLAARTAGALLNKRPGDRVEIRVRLRKSVAEALTARAVREEKNLSALVAEILEAAAKGKA